MAIFLLVRRVRARASFSLFSARSVRRHLVQLAGATCFATYTPTTRVGTNRWACHRQGGAAAGGVCTAAADLTLSDWWAHDYSFACRAIEMKWNKSKRARALASLHSAPSAGWLMADCTASCFTPSAISDTHLTIPLAQINWCRAILYFCIWVLQSN